MSVKVKTLVHIKTKLYFPCLDRLIFIFLSTALWPRAAPSLDFSGSDDLTADFHNVNKACSGESKSNISEQSVVVDVSRLLQRLSEQSVVVDVSRLLQRLSEQSVVVDVSRLLQRLSEQSVILYASRLLQRLSEQSVFLDVSRLLQTLYMNVQLKRTLGLGRSTGDIRA
ncbi:hypothetical protein MAR_000068 [Mya arenaria]|uniref:Uncharacterized protein n=1 Tax=Mya arenaria TaxID=6604 RepID=A0ABY7F7R5_MYAAR|nr:hypothetical protein MAR_000068 [Mya arenaria]